MVAILTCSQFSHFFGEKHSDIDILHGTSHSHLIGWTVVLLLAAISLEIFYLIVQFTHWNGFLRMVNVFATVEYDQMANG